MRPRISSVAADSRIAPRNAMATMSAMPATVRNATARPQAAAQSEAGDGGTPDDDRADHHPAVPARPGEGAGERSAGHRVDGDRREEQAEGESLAVGGVGVGGELREQGAGHAPGPWRRCRPGRTAAAPCARRCTAMWRKPATTSRTPARRTAGPPDSGGRGGQLVDRPHRDARGGPHPVTPLGSGDRAQAPAAPLGHPRPRSVPRGPAQAPATSVTPRTIIVTATSPSRTRQAAGRARKRPR